jgi:hypothetical protein
LSIFGFGIKLGLALKVSVCFILNWYNGMWDLIPTQLYLRRYKKYEKKHPNELAAVLNNLDTFFESLNTGCRPTDIKAGYIHPEPQGVIAIDQKKSGHANLGETRLYVYPDSDKRDLYLVTLGSKSTQKDDIAECRTFMKGLRKQKAADQ